MMVMPREFLDSMEKIEHGKFQRRASGGRARFAFKCVPSDLAA